MKYQEAIEVFRATEGWTSGDASHCFTRHLSLGDVVCVLRRHNGGPQAIDERFCEPVSALTEAEIKAHSKDWGWIIVSTQIPRQIGTDRDGVTITSLDGCQVWVKRIIRLPVATPMPYAPQAAIEMLHYRRPVDVVGFGARYMDLEWQKFCTPEMLAEQGREACGSI